MKRWPSLFIFLTLTACGGAATDPLPPPHETSNNPPPDEGEETLVIKPPYLALSEPGKQYQLIAESTLDNLKVWRSDNQRVATVNQEGLLTAVSSGSTTIHVVSGEKTASAYVVVRSAPSSPPPPQETPPPEEAAAGSSPPQPDEECGPAPAGVNPYADRVVDYEIGEGGGFNEALLPDIVLGPPHALATAPYNGSSDVFSLGRRGWILLEFTDFIPCDGPGPDLIVFENPWQVGSNSENTYAEPGTVGFSSDGVHFSEFYCSLRDLRGCAGIHPVLANPDINDIDPTDPDVAGGDPFNLAQRRVESARFIRIRDINGTVGPAANGMRGFDLDAIAVVNGRLP